jgi:hypothetical protein
MAANPSWGSGTAHGTLLVTRGGRTKCIALFVKHSTAPRHSLVRLSCTLMRTAAIIARKI